MIRRIVRAHVNEVRFCYEQGLARDPSLRGRLVVAFAIAGDGSVRAAEVKEALADAAVGECVAKAVQRWMFPKHPGAGDVHVVYPFLFEPG